MHQPAIAPGEESAVMSMCRQELIDLLRLEPNVCSRSCTLLVYLAGAFRSVRRLPAQQ